MGSYHGRKSFETFSHRRSCLVRPLLNEETLKARYPPSPAKVRSGRWGRGWGWGAAGQTRASLPFVSPTDASSLKRCPGLTVLHPWRAPLVPRCSSASFPPSPAPTLH